MNKRNTILSLVLLAFSFSLASCGDARYPRTFTVTFHPGEGLAPIASQTVKEGYLVTGIKTPEVEGDAIFDGWFLDDKFEEPFDIETYRVFDDIDLYASFTYPTITPQKITLGNDPFTHSISWIQKGVEGTSEDIIIRARKGYVVKKYAYNDDYDKDLMVGTMISYAGYSYENMTGTLSKKGDYEMTFTFDNPENFYYSIEISSASNAFEPQIVDDIHFKGDGTATNPYLVYSEVDLKYLTTHNFDKNTYVKLMNDIQISSLYDEKTNSTFDGHFTGTKSNEYIKSADCYSITLKNNSGLFMTLGENAVIEDVAFKGAVSGSNPSIGVVANYNYGKIINVDSQAVNVKSQGGKVNDINTLKNGVCGGIVGTNYGEITKCTISSARDNVIQGKIGIGGVAGINYGNIHDMQVDAIVGAYNGNELSQTVENSFSGCVAGVNYGTISRIDVYNGKINTRRIDNGKEGEGATNVGGVCGYNATTGTIIDCLFDGMRIVGDTNVGGIAGLNDGLVKNCYTGRRLRKPSNTTIAERQFISPVIGSYNVGGIVGKCGENSIITNVFSTANVWSYGMKGYTIAEKADNCIGVRTNQYHRNSSNYLGLKFGTPYSNDLQAPIGDNTFIVNNEFIVGQNISWGLGYVLNSDGKMVANMYRVGEYLDILGPGFGFRESSSHGIRLIWESSVKARSELDIPEL